MNRNVYALAAGVAGLSFVVGFGRSTYGALFTNLFEIDASQRSAQEIVINDAGTVGVLTSRAGSSGGPIQLLRYENEQTTIVATSVFPEVALVGDIERIRNISLNNQGVFTTGGKVYIPPLPDDPDPGCEPDCPTGTGAGAGEDGLVTTEAVWSGIHTLSLVYDNGPPDPDILTHLFEFRSSDESNRAYAVGFPVPTQRVGRLFEVTSGEAVAVSPFEFREDSELINLTGPSNSGHFYYFDTELNLVVDQIHDSAGPITLIRPGDALGGGQFSPQGFLFDVSDNGIVGFRAALTPGPQAQSYGLFLHDGTTATKIVDQIGTLNPDAPVGQIHHMTVNNSGLVLFEARPRDAELFVDDRALYTSSGELPSQIIRIGDPLFGSTVEALGPFDLNNLGQIVISAELTDGRQVIALATLGGVRWINADGGNWDIADNWNTGQPPGIGDTAEFNLPDTYTVALTAPVQAAAVRVDQGDVTFDLAGHAMDLGSVSVGTVPGQSAILRVPDVDNFNAQSIVVGSDENANAALVLGPDDANPAGSGAGDPDGSPGGTGASLTTRTLFIGHRGQAVIQNLTGELDTITLRPGDVPLPFPDITDVPGRAVIKNSNISVNGDVSVIALSQGDNPGNAMGVVSGSVVKSRSFDAFASMLITGQSKVVTSQRLQVGIPLVVPSPIKVRILTDGESTLEVLPSGSATIGVHGEAEVQVMNGSTFQAAGATVTVGENGSGLVEITGQSRMTADSLTLGMNAGSDGEVSVSSTTGTSTVTAPQINVAEQGSGMLRVEDGGRVNTQTIRVTLLAPGSGSSSDSIASGQGLPDGAGQLIVNGTGLVSAETIEVGALGEISGTGTIEVTEGVFNSGKVKPGASPGTLTIIGPYTQTADGELEMEFSGTGSGQYDVLSVEGDATIDGTVALQFINGFAPQLGQQFEFLMATGLANVSAASFEVRNLAPGFLFDIMPSAGGIMMTALSDGVFVPDPIPGDYNGNGVVDAADYTVWRDHLGQTFILTNENPAAATPGVVDVEDYAFWKAHFGESAGSGGGSSIESGAVPEPATMMMFVVAIMALFARKERLCH